MFAHHPNPIWEAKKNGTPVPEKPQRIKLDCVHLGPELSGTERDELGLSHYRKWYGCNAGHGPQCGCRKPQTCGPMCADYTKPDG